MADEIDKIDEQKTEKILKNLQSASKINYYQAAISTLSFLPGSISLIYGGAPLLTLSYFIVALIVVIAVFLPLLLKSANTRNWAEWISQRERLRVQAEAVDQLGVKPNRFHGLYCKVLRMQRDTALVEEKIELAAVLSEQLEDCLKKHPNS